MFAKNHIVSVRQMRRLLVLDLFAGTSLILPAAVGRLTGKAGIFAIALGAVAAGIFALFLLNTGRGCKDGYTSFCTQTLGKWGGRVYLLIYALKYFISAALLLGVFAQIVNHTFLTDIPRIVLGVALLAVCAYCTSKGVETRARLGEMLVYFIIIPVVIIIVLALPQIQLDRLWPIELLNDGGTAAGSVSAALDFHNSATAGAGGWRGFIWAALATFSLFSTIEWLLFLRPNVRRPEKARRGVLMSILWPTLLCILILITCIGVFSIEGMNGENWPTVILMQIVRFPGGFLSRQDGLMLAFWMAGIFILISGCMNYGSESLKAIFPGYRKAWMIVFPSAFVFACFLIIHQQNASALYIAFMIFAYMPLSILLPLFLRLVHWLRRGAGKAGPAEHENRSRGRSRGRGKKTAGRTVKLAGEQAAGPVKLADGQATGPVKSANGQVAGPSGRLAAKQAAGRSGKVLGLLLPLILVSGLLGGCGRAVQIEDRNYVMCLGIDKAEEGLSVSYGFPDLKALTGDGDNIHYPVSTIDGKDMDAAAEAYGKQANKRLDFGQLQMIVFGRNIIEDPKAMAEVLEYIKNHQEFTRTVLVCMADKTAKDIVALDEDVNGSIGIYLRQMFENNSKEYQLTVGDLIIGMSLPEEKQDIAVISKGKDVPVIKSIADVVGYNLAEN